MTPLLITFAWGLLNISNEKYLALKCISVVDGFEGLFDQSVPRFRPGPHWSRASPVVAVIVGGQGRDFCMADSSRVSVEYLIKE